MHLHLQPRRTVVATVAALAIGLAACGTPTGQESTDGPTLQSVYDDVEGLTEQTRTDRLVELAADEEGLDIYGGTNAELMDDLLGEFEDLYGIEPSYYRASSTSVLRRLEQEVEADFAGNDVVQVNSVDLATLDEEGQLAPLQTPLTDGIVSGGVADTWAAIYINTFIGGWNSETVTDPPSTWQELLAHDGAIALELDDWQWFATLTKQHFVGELGMTEDEVVEMFKDAARRANFIDGRTAMAELMIAGEYDVGAALFHHRVKEFQAEGAPIAWEPAIEPIVIRPNGVAIMDHVRNPATALLWVEFLLGEVGQQVIVDDFRDPASTEAEGAFPLEYEPIVLDIEASVAERDKWQGLWEEIVAEAGRDG